MKNLLKLYIELTASGTNYLEKYDISEFKRYIEKNTNSLHLDKTLSAQNRNLWNEIIANGDIRTAAFLIAQGFAIDGELLKKEIILKQSDGIERYVFIKQSGSNKKTLAFALLEHCSREINEVRWDRAKKKLFAGIIRKVFEHSKNEEFARYFASKANTCMFRNGESILRALINTQFIDHSSALHCDNYNMIKFIIEQNQLFASSLIENIFICSIRDKSKIINNAFDEGVLSLDMPISDHIKRFHDNGIQTIGELMLSCGKKYTNLFPYLYILLKQNPNYDKSFENNKELWKIALHNNDYKAIQYLVNHIHLTEKDLDEQIVFDLKTDDLLEGQENRSLLTAIIQDGVHANNAEEAMYCIRKLIEKGLIKDINRKVKYLDKEWTLLELALYFNTTKKFKPQKYFFIINGISNLDGIDKSTSFNKELWSHALNLEDEYALACLIEAEFEIDAKLLKQKIEHCNTEGKIISHKTVSIELMSQLPLQYVKCEPLLKFVNKCLELDPSIIKNFQTEKSHQFYHFINKVVSLCLKTRDTSKIDIEEKDEQYKYAYNLLALTLKHSANFAETLQYVISSFKSHKTLQHFEVVDVIFHEDHFEDFVKLLKKDKKAASALYKHVILDNPRSKDWHDPFEDDDEKSEKKAMNCFGKLLNAGIVPTNWISERNESFYDDIFQILRIIRYGNAVQTEIIQKVNRLASETALTSTAFVQVIFVVMVEVTIAAALAVASFSGAFEIAFIASLPVLGVAGLIAYAASNYKLLPDSLMETAASVSQNIYRGAISVLSCAHRSGNTADVEVVGKNL